MELKNEQYKQIKEGTPYLSNSQIETYMDCSQKWFFDKRAKVKTLKTSIAREYGDTIHKTVEMLHKFIGEKEDIPHVDDVIHWFDSSWDATTKESEIEVTDDNKKEREHLLSLGIESVTTYYHQHINTDWFNPPIMVEGKFRVPLIDLETGDIICDWEVLGFIDLVLALDDRIYVIDHKTSSRRYTAAKLNDSLQLTLYYYVILYLIMSGAIKGDGLTPGVAFNVFLKLKGLHKGESRVQFMPGERSMSDIRWLMNTIKSVVKGIQSEVFVPNRLATFCAYCDYRDACKEWGVLQEEDWYEKYSEYGKEGIFLLNKDVKELEIQEEEDEEESLF